MTISEIIALAGTAWRLYEGLKKAAQAKGMTPAEFDASALKECKRLDDWKASTDAAEDKVFNP